MSELNSMWKINVLYNDIVKEHVEKKPKRLRDTVKQHFNNNRRHLKNAEAMTQ